MDTLVITTCVHAMHHYYELNACRLYTSCDELTLCSSCRVTVLSLASLSQSRAACNPSCFT